MTIKGEVLCARAGMGRGQKLHVEYYASLWIMYTNGTAVHGPLKPDSWALWPTPCPCLSTVDKLPSHINPSQSLLKSLQVSLLTAPAVEVIIVPCLAWSGSILRGPFPPVLLPGPHLSQCSQRDSLKLKIWLYSLKTIQSFTPSLE